MGYRAKKLKVEGDIKILKRVLLGVLLFMLVGLAVFSAFVPPNTWKYRVGLPSVGKRDAGELRIHFLDVGQGDCSIIELPDGKVMMIDGGDGRASTEKTVLRYLNALKINVIDYLIVTHADADHCGSLDKVLKYKKVLKAYLPLSSPENDSEYAQFYAALLRKEISYVYTSRKEFVVCQETETYPYQISFLYPYSGDKEEIIDNEGLILSEKENYYSAVIWLDYFGSSALFTGDAPQAVEEALIRDAEFGMFDDRGVDLKSTEILKVAHHGSEDATSADFLDYLNVKTAVISCGAKNAYNHPTTAVLNRLHERNVDTYRTDFKGYVTVTMKTSGEYFVRTHK